jgi:hypothetical protein
MWAHEARQAGVHRAQAQLDQEQAQKLGDRRKCEAFSD